VTPHRYGLGCFVWGGVEIGLQKELSFLGLRGFEAPFSCQLCPAEGNYESENDVSYILASIVRDSLELNLRLQFFYSFLDRPVQHCLLLL
jgi:hypothetical protein